MGIVDRVSAVCEKLEKDKGHESAG
jgi:hypothetical protein